MKFCPECGTKAEGMKFCPECGYKTGVASAEVAAAVNETKPTTSVELNILEFQTYMFGMENKKGTLGKFEISIPQYKYTLTSERLLLDKVGVMGKKREEIELYKINDITVKQGLKDKLAGVGDIEIVSSDASTPTLTLKRIKDPNNVKETIRRAVMDRKNTMNIGYRQDI